MQVITEFIPEEIGELHVIGDLHLGDEAFTERSEQKLRQKIEEIKSKPYARVVLNGDIFNCATRISKTAPFKRDIQHPDEMDFALELFTPIADQIIGATEGNHEWRFMDFANYSLINDLCKLLSRKSKKLVSYCGIGFVLFLKVGRPSKHRHSIKLRDKPDRSNQTYSNYIQHTTGGGATPGGKVNKTNKLRQIIPACDCYFGNHDHMQGAVSPKIFIPNLQKCTVTEIDQKVINCGSYLDYPEYAEKLMCAPVTMGSPVVTYFSKERAIKITL